MNRPRAATALRQRYGAIVGYAGLIWALAAAVIASPLVSLVFTPSEWHLLPAFLLPPGVVAAAGLLAWRRLTPATPPALSLSEGAAIVVLAWGGAIATATTTFLLATPLDPVEALFEATSGWTTTGLSVVDVASAPRSVLLLRSTLELAGGAGLAILMVSVFGGPLGPGLTSAEGRSEQVVPQVVRSAKLVVVLISAYAVLGTVGLWLAGLGWFDAVNHSFAAVSTGGFSTNVASLGAWDDPEVEAVTVVLMLLGTTNVPLVWLALRGHLGDFFRSAEVRFVGVVVPASALVILFATGPLYGSVGRATRVAIFEAVSALSTTGFTLTDYAGWPDAAWFLLALLMIVGGGVGSTAGGIKQARVILLFKVTLFELRRMFWPPSFANRPRLRQGTTVRFAHDEEIRYVATVAFLYVGSWALGSLLVSLHGYSLRDALFEMASALGTVGLSAGITSPEAPNTVLLGLAAGMLLGRLEFIAVAVGLGRLAIDLRAAVRAHLVPFGRTP